MSGPAQVRSTDAIEALQPRAGPVRRARAERARRARRRDAPRRRLDRARPPRPLAQGKFTKPRTRVHQAKLDLERCLLMTTVDGQRPACREQKAALDAGQGPPRVLPREGRSRSRTGSATFATNCSSTTAASASSAGCSSRTSRGAAACSRRLCAGWRSTSRTAARDIERFSRALDAELASRRRRTPPATPSADRCRRDRRRQRPPTTPPNPGRALTSCGPPTSTPAPPTSATPSTSCKPPGRTRPALERRRQPPFLRESLGTPGSSRQTGARLDHAHGAGRSTTCTASARVNELLSPGAPSPDRNGRTQRP